MANVGLCVTIDAVAPSSLPRPPAPPQPTAGALQIDELDDDYPDVDGVAVGDDTIELRSARTVGLLRSSFTGTSFLLPDSECVVEGQDSVLVDVDLSGCDLSGGWKRVRFERCRLMGCEFADTFLKDVTFVDCALDLSSFGSARLERVRFEACRLDEVAFIGTQLTDVVFTGGISLATAIVERTKNVRVDLRGADIAGVDPSALAGCTIDPAQLIALAPRLARAARIDVRSDIDDG